MTRLELAASTTPTEMGASFRVRPCFFSRFCSAAGIGTNLFLAKVALDIVAKHVPDHIGVLDEESFREQIWHHRPITILKADHDFEYYFLEYQPKRKNPKLKQYSGMSWAGPCNRWCTAMLKTRILEKYLKEKRKEYDVIDYIGIAADETRRIKDGCYPLVEWGMTEKDCLAYCHAHGFRWGGLYEIFHRVSCWCCPLQSLSELRKLYTYFPELWKQLEEWDEKTWRQFRADYSVKELTIRFALESMTVILSVRQHMKQRLRRF